MDAVVEGLLQPSLLRPGSRDVGMKTVLSILACCLYLFLAALLIVVITQRMSKPGNPEIHVGKCKAGFPWVGR